MRRNALWAALSLYPLLFIAGMQAFSESINRLFVGHDFLSAYWYIVAGLPVAAIFVYFVIHAARDPSRRWVQRVLWVVLHFVLFPVSVPIDWWLSTRGARAEN